MSTQTLGKVSITPKGNWSAATTYAALDAVRDAGNGYLAIKASTNVPTSNSEYWMKLVDKGNTGEAAGFGTPTATVTGLPAGSAPTVSIDASGTDVEKIFAFVFGIPKGDTGVGISGIAKTSTAGLVDTYTVTYTDGTTTTFTVTNGEDGDDGAAAGFGTPTATIDSSIGTPTVTISATGPDTAKVFSFEFHNLKGATGNGIASIAKTGTSGNVDTYTITMTDGTTATFTVTNANIDDSSTTAQDKAWSAKKTHDEIDEKADKTTTVNGKALSSNVTLDGGDINVDNTAATPVSLKAKVNEQSEQIVTLQGLGLTVVNGELNITYEEA